MFSSLLNLFFPPQCLVCSQQVSTHGTLCLTCWGKIRFITDPHCAICGYPFDFDMGIEALCGQCLKQSPVYAKGRSVFRYDEHSRALVTKLKYADQTQLAKIYGRWLASTGKELIATCDAVVPVPLHYFRFLGRKYNQAALLAYALSGHCNLPVIPDGLKRTRATRPQPGLTFKQRQDNVKGAFAINPKQVSNLKGKRILLVDDVMTTSATGHECSKALISGGAAHVYVLTLARKLYE